MAFIKSCSIDYRNEQSPTCEVVHETNKVHFRNLVPNRFLPSSVGRALEWRSRGCGFQPHWMKFLTKFILFCVKICQIIWQKRVSWKTQFAALNLTETFVLWTNEVSLISWMSWFVILIFNKIQTISSRRHPTVLCTDVRLPRITPDIGAFTPVIN